MQTAMQTAMHDFDLSDRVDVAYPSTYDHQDIKERHPNEKRNQPRCTSHDQYSIIHIIRTSILLPEDQVCILQNKEECLCGENVQYTLLSALLPLLNN